MTTIDKMKRVANALAECNVLASKNMNELYYLIMDMQAALQGNKMQDVDLILEMFGRNIVNGITA